MWKSTSTRCDAPHLAGVFREFGGHDVPEDRKIRRLADAYRVGVADQHGVLRDQAARLRLDEHALRAPPRRPEHIAPHVEKHGNLRRDLETVGMRARNRVKVADQRVDHREAHGGDAVRIDVAHRYRVADDPPEIAGEDGDFRRRPEGDAIEAAVEPATGEAHGARPVDQGAHRKAPGLRACAEPAVFDREV